MHGQNHIKKLSVAIAVWNTHLHGVGRKWSFIFTLKNQVKLLSCIHF